MTSVAHEPAGTEEDRRAAPYRPDEATQARIRRVALIVGVLSAVAMLARLFLGGTVGMADNYDGHRLTCQLDVAPHPGPAATSPFEFVTPRFDAHVWYGETCGAGGQPYLSSQYAALLVSKWLTPVLGFQGALDLRVLGGVCALLFGLAMGLLVLALPGRPWLRVLAAGLVAAATLDSTVALYFVSPLSEPAGILGLLFTVVTMLRVVRRERASVLDLLLLTAAALWTVTAKPQMTAVLVAVLPVLLLRGARMPWERKETVVPPGRWRGFASGAVRRLPALALAGALVGTTAAYQAAKPAWFEEMYSYHQVFVEMLPHSPDPRADLRELGLSPALVKHSGTRINTSGLPWSPEYQVFHDTVDMPRLLSFYAGHPDRWPGMADRGLKGLVEGRAPYLGNHLEGSGHPPYAKDCRVCLVSGVFHLAGPLRWVLFPGLWLGSAALGLWVCFRRRLGPAARGCGLVLAGVAASTVVQFWGVMLSDGSNDLEKHMVFAWYGTALLPGLLVIALAALEQASALNRQGAVPGQPTAGRRRDLSPCSSRPSSAWNTMNSEKEC
ncbi:MAG TPA: hypothetical protein VIU15_45940 [Streptomyces sp.]